MDGFVRHREEIPLIVFVDIIWIYLCLYYGIIDHLVQILYSHLIHVVKKMFMFSDFVGKNSHSHNNSFLDYLKDSWKLTAICQRMTFIPERVIFWIAVKTDYNLHKKRHLRMFFYLYLFIKNLVILLEEDLQLQTKNNQVNIKCSKWNIQVELLFTLC